MILRYLSVVLGTLSPFKWGKSGEIGVKKSLSKGTNNSPSESPIFNIRRTNITKSFMKCRIKQDALYSGLNFVMNSVQG